MHGTNSAGAGEGGKPPMLNYPGGGPAGMAQQNTSIGANPAAAGSGLRKLSLNPGGNPLGGMGAPGMGLGMGAGGGSTTNMGSLRSSNASMQQSNAQQPLAGLSSGMPGALRRQDNANSQEDLQQKPLDQPFRSAETPQRPPYGGVAGFTSNQLDLQSQFGDGLGQSAYPQTHQYQSV